jgi:hypothetical protein
MDLRYSSTGFDIKCFVEFFFTASVVMYHIKEKQKEAVFNINVIIQFWVLVQHIV